MSTERNDLEALARDAVDAYAETVGDGWQQPAVKGMRAVVELVAARLQPARVPGHRVADLLHLLQFATITTPTTGDAEQAQKVMMELRAMLAAPAPTPGDSLSLHGAAGRSVSRPAAGDSLRGGETHSVYVECRQCDACGHAGINDSKDGIACCTDCGWSGNAPQEDKCPGCGREGVMTTACPKCESRYTFVADADITAHPAPPPAEPGDGREVGYSVGRYGDWGSGGKPGGDQAPGYPAMRGSRAVAWFVYQDDAAEWVASKVNPSVPETGDGGREGVEALTALVQEWRTRIPSDAPTSERVGMREYCADQLEAVIRRLASAPQPESPGEFGEQFIDGMGWVIPMRNVIKCAAFMLKGAQDMLNQIDNLPPINPDIPKPAAPAPMNDETKGG